MDTTRISSEVAQALIDGLKAAAVYGGTEALAKQMALVNDVVANAKTVSAGLAEAAALIAPKPFSAADRKNLKDMIEQANEIGGASAVAHAMRTTAAML